MSVSLLRLDEVPAQIKRRYWINSKPGLLSSKPGMSMAIVEPSTSKATVEHSTSEAVVGPSKSRAFKAPRYEVHDENLLFDSSPPKRRRVSRARMLVAEELKEMAQQAAEVSRKHKKRIQEPETLRVGKAKDPNRPAKKVHSDHAKLNRQ